MPSGVYNRISAQERFNKLLASKVNGDCMLWIGCKMKGYGQFFYDGKVVLAHRFNWEQINGAIPKKWEIDHECKNRACVNIKHLKLVPCGFNVRQGAKTSAENRRNRICCKRGHIFNKENTYVRSNGSRNCRTCKRINYMDEVC
jgi:hypothetical protein